MIDTLLADRPLNRLSAVQGILGLEESVGPQRLEAACARALYFGDIRYRRIKDILNAALDCEPLPEAVPSLPEPPHVFARSGAEFFAPAQPPLDCPGAAPSWPGRDRAGTHDQQARGGAAMMSHPLLPKLRQLKLSGMALTLDVRAAQAIERQLSPLEFLALLLDDELERRDQSRLALRLAQSGCDSHKTLAHFDFLAAPAINRTYLQDLSTCVFVACHENVLMCGPSGVGKTHLAIALSLRAYQAGYKVLFLTAQELVTQLLEAEQTQALPTLFKTPDQAQYRFAVPIDVETRKRFLISVCPRLLSPINSNQSTLATVRSLTRHATDHPSLPASK